MFECMRDMEMETTGNACEPFTTPRGRRWEPYSNLSFILGEECGFGKLLNKLPGAPICGDPIDRE